MIEKIVYVVWLPKQWVLRSSKALAQACCTVGLWSLKYEWRISTSLKQVLSREAGLSIGSKSSSL